MILPRTHLKKSLSAIIHSSLLSISKTLKTALSHSIFSLLKFLLQSVTAILLLSVSPHLSPSHRINLYHLTLFFNLSLP